MDVASNFNALWDEKYKDGLNSEAVKKYLDSENNAFTNDSAKEMFNEVFKNFIKMKDNGEYEKVDKNLTDEAKGV